MSRFFKPIRKSLPILVRITLSVLVRQVTRYKAKHRFPFSGNGVLLYIWYYYFLINYYQLQ